MTSAALTEATASGSPLGTVVSLGWQAVPETAATLCPFFIALRTNERAAREGMPPHGGLYGQYRAFSAA